MSKRETFKGVRGGRRSKEEEEEGATVAEVNKERLKRKKKVGLSCVIKLSA